MAIIIRKGRDSDFPVIMELVKDLATFEKASKAVKNSVERMRKEKEHFDFFVAEENGKILGYALYFFAYYTWVGKSLYLDDLYVRPELRNRRIGSMLLGRVFEVARKEKCKRLRWQVLDWNANAIGFYRKHGAAITSQWLNCDFDETGINKFLQTARKNKRQGMRMQALP